MTPEPPPDASPAAGDVSPEAQQYLDDVPAAHRPLLERVDGLVRRAHPEVSVVLSYGMPTYVAGKARLHVGVWKHGISLYGWDADHDGGFCARHPELHSGRGTIRLRPGDAESVTDEELLAVVVGALRRN